MVLRQFADRALYRVFDTIDENKFKPRARVRRHVFDVFRILPGQHDSFDTGAQRRENFLLYRAAA